jgi:hypothetical protein
MKTRAIQSAAVVAIVCWALAFGASADSAVAYEFIRTGWNVALFSNLSEATFVGLRVVFTGEVAPIQAIGIGGATFELLSNETGVLIYEGTILPLGMFEIDWAFDGPRIDAAFWIGADGVEYGIDVHAPYARMWYVLPLGTDEYDDGCVSYVPIGIEFKGNWSKDPDGLPLVRYQWSWSDGIVLESENVERTFRLPGWYTVILTVWDVEGLTHSTTDSFYIHRYRCGEE